MDFVHTLGMIWMAIGGWALFAALLYAFYGPLQQSFTDECRQAIFEARDKIFLVANQTELDDSIHRNIRDELNLLIRYAHKITWTRILLSYLFRKYGSGRRVSIIDLLESIERPSTRATVNQHVRTAMLAIVHLVINRSLLLRFVRFGAKALRAASNFIIKKERDVFSASTAIVHDAYEVELSSAKTACAA